MEEGSLVDTNEEPPCRTTYEEAPRGGKVGVGRSQ